MCISRKKTGGGRGQVGILLITSLGTQRCLKTMFSLLESDLLNLIN